MPQRLACLSKVRGLCRQESGVRGVAGQVSGLSGRAGDLRSQLGEERVSAQRLQGGGSRGKSHRAAHQGPAVGGGRARVSMGSRRRYQDHNAPLWAGGGLPWTVGVCSALCDGKCRGQHWLELVLLGSPRGPPGRRLAWLLGWWAQQAARFWCRPGRGISFGGEPRRCGSSSLVRQV